MSASYPSAVKTFTTRSAGQTIGSAHVNDLQDEVNAVESGLLNGMTHAVVTSTGYKERGRTTFLGEGSSFSGSWTLNTIGTVTSGTSNNIMTLIGKTCMVSFSLTAANLGSSAATIILSWPSSQTPSHFALNPCRVIQGASTSALTAFCFVQQGSPQISVQNELGTFSSGATSIQGQIFFNLNG